MGKKRVVVVDDDSLVSKAIDLCLSKRGHDVKVFYNGVEAIKHLLEERPDSLVLDIRLPDCDGWFIARLLERLEEKVPVILISVNDPDRHKLAEVRPYAYIQKPFDMGQLVQLVERSLSWSEQFVGA